MHIRKQPKTKLKKSVFGTFFVMLAIISNLLNLVCLPLTTHAISSGPETIQTAENTKISENFLTTDNFQTIAPIQIAETTQNNRTSGNSQNPQINQNQQNSQNSPNNQDSQDNQNNQTTEENRDNQTTEAVEESQTVETTEVDNSNTHTDTCQEALGAIGWLVCPTTGKLAEAVDWLYDKLEDILQINPVEAKDGSPIYEVWKVFLSFTNFVFHLLPDYWCWHQQLWHQKRSPKAHRCRYYGKSQLSHLFASCRYFEYSR